MVLQDPTMCRRRLPRIVPISHYFMRRKRSLLCHARTKLLCNYPRKVLEGIRGGQVARTSHAPSSSSSSDPCPPQGRSRRIYDLTVLRVGETVLRKVDTRKFPSCLVFMYDKYPARMDDDEAAVTSCAVHLSFWRQRFAY